MNLALVLRALDVRDVDILRALSAQRDDRPAITLAAAKTVERVREHWGQARLRPAHWLGGTDPFTEDYLAVAYERVRERNPERVRRI